MTENASSERQRDAERKRQVRWAANVVTIRPCADPARRKRLEADDLKWQQYYFADTFTEPFCEHQIAMADSIKSAVIHGGDQAIAAPRGEGKSTIAECVTLKLVLQGVLPFAVLLAATGPDAERSLATIKEHLEDNPRLAQDYPEVCDPIAALESTPNRARTMVAQRIGGPEDEQFEPTRIGFQWSGKQFMLPNVPFSCCAKSIIATRGLDAAIRGLKIGSRRPNVAVIDDPDTEESAESELQTEKIIKRIERAVAGLAPKGKRMARVLLTTLQNGRCASAQYTDPQQKPSWNGKRFKFLQTPPARVDTWDEYMAMRQAAQQAGDEFARKSHEFYLAHREEMDAEAVVINPLSFDGRVLKDGSQLQISALQRYYDFVADNGLDAALCELQNDPPEESGPIDSGITAHRIQRQVNGWPRRIVPPGCTVLVQGLDIGKYACHWVVKAFQPGATGFVIDYGVQEVHGTTRGADEATDRAIIRALYTRREEILAKPYMTPDGQPLEIKKTLVDAGYRTQAVYFFCHEAGIVFQPAMGFGKSAGCVQPRFYAPVRASIDKKPGNGWFLSRKLAEMAVTGQWGGHPTVWLVCMDADRWKAWEHDRWMTPPGDPGTCTLFGERGIGDRLSADEKGHISFAKHLTANVERELIDKKKA